MLSQNIFNILFVFPLINILVAFYKLFLFLKIPGALGFAILGLTFLIKSVTHPLFKKQMESAKKIQEIQPQLQKLQKKYKKDPKKLQEAQMELYKKYGINPALGCLLAIIQIPIFIALYQAFIIFLNLKKDGEKAFLELNKVLYFKFLEITSIDPNFFGFDLTLSPAQAGNPVYYIVPAITGILQYYLSTATTYSTQSTERVKNGEKNNKEELSDFQKAFQMQSKFLFPLFLAWISFSFPVGLSLYWNFFTLLSIWQIKRINNR